MYLVVEERKIVIYDVKVVETKKPAGHRGLEKR